MKTLCISYLHYCWRQIWITISDNKYSTNHHGLLKTNPCGKIYSAHTPCNYHVIMSYPPGWQLRKQPTWTWYSFLQVTSPLQICWLLAPEYFRGIVHCICMAKGFGLLTYMCGMCTCVVHICTRKFICFGLIPTAEDVPIKHCIAWLDFTHGIQARLTEHMRWLQMLQ